MSIMSDTQINSLGRVGGWAPGRYFGRCHECGDDFTGDKRAIHCLFCGIKAVTERLDFLEEATRLAGQAVDEALGKCQHNPNEWIAMPRELRDFKLEIFNTLELRCLNLPSHPRKSPIEERSDDASPVTPDPA